MHRCYTLSSVKWYWISTLILTMVVLKVLRCLLGQKSIHLVPAYILLRDCRWTRECQEDSISFKDSSTKDRNSETIKEETELD